MCSTILGCVYVSGSVVKTPPTDARDTETQVCSPSQEDPQRRKWQPASVFLPGKFNGQGSLAVYSPWSCRVKQG